MNALMRGHPLIDRSGVANSATGVDLDILDRRSKVFSIYIYYTNFTLTSCWSRLRTTTLVVCVLMIPATGLLLRMSRAPTPMTPLATWSQVLSQLRPGLTRSKTQAQRSGRASRPSHLQVRAPPSVARACYSTSRRSLPLTAPPASR